MVDVRLRCFIFLCFIFITSRCFAHDIKIETVVVEGRQISLVGDALSASQGLVGQAELENRPTLRTGEMLELIPGMVVTQHSGSGKANQYFLRGFNLDHGTDFSTHIDGMPINMRSHGHGQGYTDLNFIIPETIETIRFQKGAYSADVGDFSGAGSAEIKTLSSIDKGKLKLSVGENNYIRAVSYDRLESAGGQWFYGLEANLYDGPWTDISEDINKFNGLLKFKRELGDGQFELGLMSYRNTWNSADQIPHYAVDNGQIDELGSIDTTVGGESSRQSINGIWQSENIYASAYIIEYELNLWSNFTYFLVDEINGDQFEQVDERLIYGGEISYQAKSHLANFHTENKIGVQLRVDDIDEVGLYQSRARTRIGAVRSDAIKEHSIALFAENKLEWNSWLRSIIGVRYDQFDFEVDPLVNLNINNVDLSENQGEADDSIFSLKASLIAAINDSSEAYLSFGQGFHSNDARGTTIKIDPETGAAAQAVDPLVQSLGYEIGIRGFIEEKINTSLAIWWLDLDSELLFVGDAGNTEASAASSRRGAEATVYYSLNENWSFDIEYALSDAEFTGGVEEGQEIPGAIDQVIQAGVNLKIGDRWNTQLRLRYFGERPLIEDNSVRSEASTMVNLKTSYNKKNWAINLEVLNLLDSNDHDITYFYESRSVPGTESVEDVHYHVFEPRTLRLGFIAKY